MMCKLPVKYSLFTFILFTHFILCEEYDMALILEKLEHLASKVEIQTSDKHEEITKVLAKLDSLILKTKNLFSIQEEYASIPDEYRTYKQCDDECREKNDIEKKEVITDFIHELLKTISNEKKQHLALRTELRDFSHDLVKDLPENDRAQFRNRLLSLDLKLEEYEYKYDLYLIKLQKEEDSLQIPNLTSVKKIEIACNKEDSAKLSVNDKENTQVGAFKTKLVNDSIKVLNAEILFVQQEIDLTVKRIYEKPQFSP